MNVSDILNFEEGLQNSGIVQDINHSLSETNKTAQELLKTSAELQEQLKQTTTALQEQMKEANTALENQLQQAKEALEKQLEILERKVEEIQGLTELGETVNKIIEVLKNVISDEPETEEETPEDPEKTEGGIT